MWSALTLIFDSTMFAPHGICLLWEPELIWLHVISDAMIAAAYFSIPVALSVFVYKRRDVEFSWIFWAFAFFILACGLTHILSIVTLWLPIYGIEGLVKAATALASVMTAAILWPLVPKLLAIPSPAQLVEAEAALQQEARYRREAEDMLRHTQKMEAIGQLTGGVAHDFNNLLTVVSGNLEIASRTLTSGAAGSKEKLARLISNASAGAQRAAVLTRRLLAFARRQPLAPTVINVSQFLTGMSDFLRRTLGEHISLEVVGAAGVWQIEVDISEMEAALLNLAANARDAMPEGGCLTIECSNTFLDEFYVRQHADVIAGQYVQISVTDNGPGMPRDVKEKAFDPFFTTKDPGQGTGLGLSQVYGFVKQSGGHVAIYSELGEGTTIRLYLPRCTKAAQAGSEDEVAVVGSHTREIVLVVEDDAEVRSYLVETLEYLGYSVIEAGNGEQAITVFETLLAKVDLVLTDVVMPGMNGRQLAEKLKARDPELKVLFMTGYSRNAIVHQGRLDDGVALVQKPINQKILAEKLREVLDRPAHEHQRSHR